MAQGLIKKKPASAKKSTPQQLAPKRGARVLKPKKANAIRHQKLLKKHTSGLTAQTERTLAAKAGHMEILGGGKKDKAKDVKAKKKGG